MNQDIRDFFMNLITGLIMVSILGFVILNIYHTYSTIQFQQKMILELEYKCGWYIDDKENKDE